MTRFPRDFGLSTDAGKDQAAWVVPDWTTSSYWLVRLNHPTLKLAVTSVPKCQSCIAIGQESGLQDMQGFGMDLLSGSTAMPVASAEGLG